MKKSFLHLCKVVKVVWMCITEDHLLSREGWSQLESVEMELTGHPEIWSFGSREIQGTYQWSDWRFHSYYPERDRRFWIWDGAGEELASFPDPSFSFKLIGTVKNWAWYTDCACAELRATRGEKGCAICRFCSRVEHYCYIFIWKHQER